MGVYKSRLRTILLVYQNQITKIEQDIAQVIIRRKEAEEKLAYEAYKENVLRELMESGEPIDSSFFMNAYNAQYEWQLKQEIQSYNEQISKLNIDRHELTKKKDWVIDEDKKREARHHREELIKEERRMESDEEGEV